MMRSAWLAVLGVGGLSICAAMDFYYTQRLAHGRKLIPLETRRVAHKEMSQRLAVAPKGTMQPDSRAGVGDHRSRVDH